MNLVISLVTSVSFSRQGHQHLSELDRSEQSHNHIFNPQGSNGVRWAVRVSEGGVDIIGLPLNSCVWQGTVAYT